MHYDTENVFAKILRGEIPCKKLFENAQVLAFHDIAPQAPVHVLVIPKQAYLDAGDFFTRASAEDIAAYFDGVREVVAQLALEDYRLISNKGEAAGQTVFHFHTHILSGKPLGALVGDA